MADEYMLLSEVIIKLNQREEEFLREKFEANKKAIEDWDKLTESDDPDLELDFSQEPELLIESFEFDNSDDWGRYFWFYTECSPPDLGGLETIFTEFLKEFRPDDAIIISWSITWSKPIAAGFGGGAMVITSKGSTFINVRDWAIKKATELGAIIEPEEQPEEYGHDGMCIYCGSHEPCTDTDCNLSDCHSTTCSDCIKKERGK